MKTWFQRRRQIIEIIGILFALFAVALFWFFLFLKYGYL